MSVYYKISLQPLAPFFFGEDTNAELGNKQNYFQKSMQFPAQTTLLGMLRHHLLMKKGWAFPKVNTPTNDDIINLIGLHGFQPDADNKFGVIERISPVFITKDNQGHYFLCNKLKIKLKETEVEVAYRLDSGNSFSFASTNENFVLSANGNKLTDKDNFVEELRNLDDHSTIKTDEVFGISLRSGNTKIAYRDELSEDNAYYRFQYARFKQTEEIVKDKPFNKRKICKSAGSLLLKDNYQFAFYADLTDESLEDGYDGYILMGKEQSVFKLTIQKMDTKPLLFQSLKSGKRLWLLSPLKPESEQSFQQKIQFACADNVVLRSFTKGIDENKSTERWNFNLPQKSGGTNMYQRGGILYMNDQSSIKADNWSKIGYNYFATI